MTAAISNLPVASYSYGGSDAMATVAAGLAAAINKADGGSVTAVAATVGGEPGVQVSSKATGYGIDWPIAMSATYNASEFPGPSFYDLTSTNVAGGYPGVAAVAGSGAYTELVYSPSGSKIAVVQNGALVKGTVALPGGASAIYNSAGFKYFRHRDWLGSSRLATTWAHTAYSKTAYAPFGESYNQAGTTDLSFTGEDQDTSAGVYDFQFRKYDSVAGRFMSPDPLGIASGSLANPQSLNLYSYVLNNPLVAVDPDGRECVWDDGSYDSNDDPDTGSADKCSGQGGTWIGHDVFANSSYYRGDWSGDANSSLSGLVGNIQSCSAAVGGGQGASLLIADAFASGFSNDQTAYTLASAAWESGPGGIGTNMTEVGSPSYFNKYNGILGNTSNADAYAYRGRGYVQITGKSNYQKWSNELSTNLVANPNLAATPDVAAQIAVEGLDRGSFTGVSLANYVNSGGTDFVNARRTINGTDNAQAIASSANSFSQSLAGCR